MAKGASSSSPAARRRKQSPNLVNAKSPKNEEPRRKTPKRGRKSQDIPEKDRQLEETDEQVDRVVTSAEKLHTTPDAKRKGPVKKSSKKISDIHVVEEQELKAALAKIKPKHEAEQSALLDSYKASYRNWLFQLKSGFGLVMYGFGSKRKLLEDFATTTLTDGGVVVVNGYLPNINLKQVLRTLKDTLYENSGSSSTSSEDVVSVMCNYQGDSIIYLVIHSIDGPALREGSTQELLAKLAACSHFYVVASMDNINGPILWDKRMANTQFNWWWHHTPTYAPYDAEAVHVPLILSASGVKRSLRSAVLVLQSLTPNAQSVFKVMADHQLANPDDEGLTQHQLYTKCREKFLVSSELTLRAHLTEFRDHELVRTRKGSDGQDCLYITLPDDALAQLLEDIK